MWRALLAGLAALAALSAQTLIREDGHWVELETGMVATSGPVSLQVNTRGDVAVTSGGGSQVSYTLRKRVKAATEQQARAILANCRTGANRVGPQVTVELQCGNQAVRTALELKAPSGAARAQVLTSAGAVRVDDFPGELMAVSGGGALAASRIGGGAVLRTASGPVHVDGVGGVLRVNTASGGIRVEKTASEAWLETTAGEIVVGFVGGVLHASTAGGNVHVSTAVQDVYARSNGGLITVSRAGGIVRAETYGGSIRVSSANGVRCESGAGAIRLRDVTGELKAITAAGSILAELLEGAVLGNSLLSADQGDITVWIPSNVRVTVQAFSESAGSTGRIVSEFPEVRSMAAVRADGRATAFGAINGGGPVLKIAANSGNVYLRRRE